jgi:formylglycine-generating enzyme required for sulfatase activity
MGELTDEDALLLQREQGVILKPIPDADAINKLLTPQQLAVSQAVTNSIGMVLVPVPAGEFQMGNPDANNQHRVKITNSFYLCAFEVTQRQYAKVMGRPIGTLPFFPRHYRGPNKPMRATNYNGATAFCQKLSAMPEEKEANRVYRLPTEAEWEYACRAGTTTTYSFGDDPSQLDAHGWYYENSGRQIHSVAQKNPNPWRLYDMHGNVDEWCCDWYGDYPSVEILVNPTGPEEGSGRVYRGGSCWTSAKSCTSAARSSMDPASHGDTRGFRVVMTYSEDGPDTPKN